MNGSAGVSPAVFGVPPNTSSPDTHRAGRRSAHQDVKDGLWKTEGECGARRPALRPGRSRSSIIPLPCPIKVNQSDSVGQAGGQNPCKSLTMSSLQNKQLSAGQTILNLVKHGQKEPMISRRCQKSGCVRLQPESSVMCLRSHPKGELVLAGRFRRRDADGGGRDDRAPLKIANDRGLQVRSPFISDERNNPG
jgi:hypothetical protein